MYSAKDLLSEFETLTTAEWMQSIEKYLKGKSFRDIVQNLDGSVEIKPFYRKEDNNMLQLPALNDNNWLIAESFVYDGSNANSLNKMILKALEGGANAINLKIEGGNPEDLNQLLEDVFVEMIDLNFSGKALQHAAADWLSIFAKIPNSEKSRGYLILELSDNEKIALLKKYAAQLPNFSFFSCCLTIDAQILSGLVALLQELRDSFEKLILSGLSADQAQEQINIHIELSDDYFLSIAGLRALKRLWLGMLEAYDVKNAIYPKILVQTAQSAVSDDPYWNLISNTTQALSAAVAQVYSIEVRPTDNSAEKAEFSRRIARNAQQLLKMESHIDHVIDPSAGSYYIENYTAEIVKNVWNKFILLNS
jgi:methylmalonyl-CoA mutase